MSQKKKLVDRPELQELPEFQELLRKLEKNQSCALFYLDRLTHGKSGAFVYHVSCKWLLKNETSNLVLKLTKREDHLGEEESLHKKAINEAKMFAKKHLPSLLASEHDDENCALLYTIAGFSFNEFHTLSGKWNAKRLLEIFRAVNKGILEDWNGGQPAASDSVVKHPAELLQEWVGSKIESGEVETLLSNLQVPPEGLLLLDAENKVYPNPLAYAKRRGLWIGSRNISAIAGHLHGDLNLNNVLARPRPAKTQNAEREKTDPEYYLIDLTGYREKSSLFFDNAYLELSYLIENRKHIEPEWGQLLSGTILEEGGTPPQLEGFRNLLCSLREDTVEWIEKKFKDKGMKDDVKTQYFLAGVAAGLDFCNKRSLSEKDRYGALVYSAMNLKAAMGLLQIKEPLGPAYPLKLSGRMHGTSRNQNVHVVNKRVTPENIKADLARIFGKNWRDRRRYPDTKPVFVLYIGGSVGMVRQNPYDSESQLVKGSMSDLIKYLYRLRDLRFDMDFCSFEKPLDSSNVAAGEWIKIARIIESCYEYYQGFVILHGADTMAYTASSLSFMFEKLGKPVILTGAETPPSDMDSDAGDNITRAIRLAAPQASTECIPTIPEVCIFFGNRLVRGNRAKKAVALATREEGFGSPNCALLGEWKKNIEINRNVILQQAEPRNFKVDARTKPDQVWIFEVFPNMNIDNFVKIALSENIRGIILKTFGTGNAPTTPKFLATIKDALTKRKVIVNLTQCPKGQVEVNLFETNAHLFDLGVVDGGDITTEAAFCKLSYLLAKYENNIAKIESEMQTDLRGEQTFSVYNLSYHNELIQGVFNGAPKRIGSFNPDQIHHVRLLIYDMRAGSAGSGEIRLKVFMNCRGINKGNWMKYKDRLIGSVERRPEGKMHVRQHWQGKIDTTILKKIASSDGTASLHIVSEGKDPVIFGTLELSIFTRRSASDYSI